MYIFLVLLPFTDPPSS